LPTQELSMRKLKKLLRLRFELGLSQDQIARSCSISQGAVSKYLKRAQAAGAPWPLSDHSHSEDSEILLASDDEADTLNSAPHTQTNPQTSAWFAGIPPHPANSTSCGYGSECIPPNNRTTEMALTTAEKIASLGSVLWGYVYPRARFRSACGKVLFQQFHDSLESSANPERYSGT
jgi:hypothetical protein